MRKKNSKAVGYLLKFLVLIQKSLDMKKYALIFLVVAFWSCSDSGDTDSKVDSLKKSVDTTVEKISDSVEAKSERIVDDVENKLDQVKDSLKKDSAR